MDALKSLVDALKLTAYDLLAVLLPGSLLVRGLSALFAGAAWAPSVSSSSDPLGFTALAYAAGLVVQGAGRVLGGSTPPVLLAEARAAVRRRYEIELPDRLVIDFCLTKLEGRRGVYDKFVALRGMCRGLLITAGLLGLCRAATLPGAEARLLVLFGTSLVCLSLYGLHRQYAPLATQAVVGMFIAQEAQPRPRNAAAALAATQALSAALPPAVAAPAPEAVVPGAAGAGPQVLARPS